MPYQNTAKQTQTMESFGCKVAKVSYRNESNGYSVIWVHDYPEDVLREKQFHTIVGILPGLHEGDCITVTGFWKEHPKYGKSFHVQEYSELLPTSEYAIKEYLCSGAFPGIGEYTAQRIVAEFGDDTLNVLDEHPERLLEIEGIKKKRAEKILEGWRAHKDAQDAMVFLHGLDLGPVTINKIHEAYGKDSAKIIQENPYRLIDDIEGIGFKIADAIGKKLGIAKDSFDRIRHGILYILNQNAAEGHCYATEQDLIYRAVKLLEVEGAQVVMTLDNMRHNQDIILERIDKTADNTASNRAVYIRSMFFSERGIAKRLAEIAASSSGIRIPPFNRSVIPYIEKNVCVVYDAIQEKALLKAMESKCMVITGGPGTGKTTLIRGLILADELRRCRILLAAPTGKAAKRMQEATGKPAVTIHRLLEATPEFGFKKNENNPLDGDVLIVDECSMIDTVLMYSLLRAVPDHMTVIFVGDIDQLPSVGAGNVLRDIISSNTVPVVQLRHIFRQAETSRIITNAHKINNGTMPDLSYQINSDFFFCVRNSQDIQSRIIDLVQNEIPKIRNISRDQIQVLSPMKQGDVGTLELNRKLQAALNHNTEQIKFGEDVFRVGDRVMQIRNDYDKNVFNGDVGKIVKIDKSDDTLLAEFDGRSVRYSYNDLNDLILAYAATVHKSQGSEYQAVVMPVTMSHRIMLQRNMMYTGVTRAKKLLIMVGDPAALQYAVQNNPAIRRNTLLQRRMQDAFAATAAAQTRKRA